MRRHADFRDQCVTLAYPFHIALIDIKRSQHPLPFQGFRPGKMRCWDDVSLRFERDDELSVKAFEFSAAGDGTGKIDIH